MARKRRPKRNPDSPPRTGRRRVLIAGAVVVALGAAVSVVLTSRRGTRLTPEDRVEIVAEVVGRKIPRAEFERQLSLRPQQMGPHAASQRRADATDVIEDFIGHEILVKEARARGLVATEQEVRARQEERVEQAIQQFMQQEGLPDRDALRDYLARHGKTLEGLRQAARAELPSVDVLRESILVEKLLGRAIADVTVSDVEVRRLFGTITAERAWIALVANPDAPVTLPDDRAVRAVLDRRAEEFLEALRAGKTFAAAAEEPRKSLTQTGLDFPEDAPLSELPRELQQASVSLEIGQLSEPIAIGDQLHIIVVRERTETLPPDFEDHKEQLRQELLGLKREEAVKAAREGALERGWESAELYDHELIAYRMMDFGADWDEIEAALADALAVDPDNATLVHLQGRRLLGTTKHNVLGRKKTLKRALALLQQAAEMAPDCPAIQMDMAAACIGLDRVAEGFEHVAAASKLAITLDNASLFIHLRARTLYDGAGMSDEYAQEMAWIQAWAVRARQGQTGAEAGTAEEGAS